MCGIAGIVDLAGQRPVDREQLALMSAALIHRGPDDEGSFVAPGIGMASRRLSIIEVQGNRQPAFNEDRSIISVINGELFDYLEHRQQLQRNGHHFASPGDSEVLVHMWEERQESVLADLRGQYAFAVFDTRRRLLTLARDRFGICPLHWAINDRWLYFASEIKSILASGQIRPEADVLGLDNVFSMFAMPGPRTAFKGIQSIPPGGYLPVQLGRDGEWETPVPRRYWEMSFPSDNGSPDRRGADSFLDELNEKWKQAIVRRLSSDQPVAAYLSGGVDSALSAVTASQISGNAIPTITAQLEGKLDERSEAAQLARLINSEHHVVECSSSDLASTFPAVVQAADSPVVDINSATLWRLSQAAQQRGFKVVLAGEGADECFAGYPWFKMQKLISLGWIRRQPSARLVSAALQWWFRSAPKNYFQELNRRMGGLHGHLLMYHLSGFGRWNLLSKPLFETLREKSAFDQLELPTSRMQQWHPLNRALFFGYRTMLPGLLLNHRGDRTAMANSIEVRYPFLDEDLVDFAAQLPPHLKLAGPRRDKMILRKLAEQYLPTGIARRPKAMFQAHFGDCLLKSPPAYVRQLLSPESLAATGYFDADKVSRFFQRQQKRTRIRRIFLEMALCCVVGTQLWHHMYLGGGLCDLPTWSAPSVSLSNPILNAIQGVT